jgi:hypothetical protein
MKIPDIFFAEGEEWREIKGYENRRTTIGTGT